MRFLMTKEMEQAIIPTLEEDIRTRFILEVDAKQRKFLGTFELKDAVNFCIEIVKEEQSKQSALLSQELKERDEEWNKYTDMHDDVMLNQIDELKARLKEHKNALEFARGAIGDAIYLEDGLDGGTGQIVINMITEVLDDKDEYESTFKDGE